MLTKTNHTGSKNMSISMIYGYTPNNPKTAFTVVTATQKKSRRSGEVRVMRPDADGNLRVGVRTPRTEQQKAARAENRNPKGYVFGF